MPSKVTVADIKNGAGALAGNTIRWDNLKEDDEGNWIEIIGSRAVIQVVRILEDSDILISGRCIIEGRNANDVDGVVLNSKRNTKMNFNNNAMEELNEIPRYIRVKGSNIKNGSFSVIVMATL